jgi:hypothetical protein
MSAAVLLEIVVKTSIVLLLAWAATRVMARRSAAGARHLVWAAALTTALFVPALVLFGPAWHVAGLPGGLVPAVRAVMSAPAAASRADGEVWPATPLSGSHAPMTVESGRRSDAFSRGRRLLQSSVVVWQANWPVLACGRSVPPSPSSA